MNLLEETEEMNDEEIFLLASENSEYFGEIIDRYEKKLDRYISKISSLSFDDRKDLLQEIFISAYEKIYSFEKGEKFSPWIYRITHNKTIDNWRKNKKRQEDISVESNLSFIESKFFKNEVEDEIQFMENQELLKKLFSKLSIKYKEIFILRFDEEKSYEEISEILKIPKSSVGTLISRVKKKLQEEYKKINK